jgi:hypothetical protein
MSRLKRITPFLIPSLADIMFVALFLLLSLSVNKGLLNDCDTGYHIRAGEYIIDTFSIPKHDIFSFISPALPWTAHEWLSEVIMAAIHRAAGLTGVVIFFSFMISLVYYLMFKVIRKYNGNILAASFITLLVLLTSQIHWLARPHIFSLVLMVVWYYLLDKYQYQHENYLYLLAPMMLLWVNLHGGFLAGFILIGIYLVGNFVMFITSEDSKRDLHRQKAGKLGLLTAICLLVCLINPYTYHILLFPFKLTSNKFLMDHVLEFMSPNFHKPSIIFFEFFMLLTLGLFALSRIRLNIIELTMVILFTHMSLFSARYIPLFAIIVAPVLVRQAEPMLERSGGKFISFFKKRASNISTIDASAKGYLWPILAVVLVVFVAAKGKIEHSFDEKIKPVAAVEFLKKETLHGNMFDNDEFGDYIIYAAWPQYKVFFDGRSDMYGTDFVKEYFKVRNFEQEWKKIIEKYDITWIIYNANSVFSRFLIQNDDWKLIYADKVANIFLKNIPENQSLIEKYSNVEPVIEEDTEDEID